MVFQYHCSSLLILMHVKTLKAYSRELNIESIRLKYLVFRAFSSHEILNFKLWGVFRVQDTDYPFS